MTDDAPAKLISDLKIDTDARSTLPYDQWVQGLGLPLHTGYFI